MFARNTARAFKIALAALLALPIFPMMSEAQEWPNWSPWERPTYRRPPPLVVQPYDDRYDEPSDDQYEPRYERPRDNRGYNWRYGNRGYRERYRPDRNPRFDERYDEFEEPDTAREPTDEGGQNRIIGADGGPRPYIAPAAPPAVAFYAPYASGSIVIDTSARKLFYVTRPGSAYVYPIGVGREGFSWTGSEKVSRIADWPDWYPPAEMRQRKPELPERMLGGLKNPLGAKAIYLGTTLYRIHGTNDPKSIGKAESSGCFRMLNAHVLHLAELAQTGTQVTVVKSLNGGTVVAKRAPPPQVRPPQVRPPQVRPQPQPPRVARPRPRLWSEEYDNPYDEWR